MNILQVREDLVPLNLSAPTEVTKSVTEYFDFYQINFSKTLDDVEHYFGTLQSPLTLGGETAIVAHYFERKGAQRTCFIVHGFTDHVGIYRKLINYLLHRGCSVVCFDLPGHGLSDGEPLYVDDFSDYLLAFKMVIATFNGHLKMPWHLFGQSMGGAISMDYLLSSQFDDRSVHFEKVILLAPLVRPAGWRAIRYASFLLSPFLRRVSRRFTMSSTDDEFLRFQREDDVLQSKHIPTAWVKAMIRWVRRYKKLNWLDHPVLVIQGLRDETVDFQYGLPLLQQKFPKARVITIQDARHHLVCESDTLFERVTQAADIYFDRREKPRDPD